MVKINPIKNLKYPPLKPKQLPEKLIWHGINEYDIHEFHMFTTKSQKPMTALMKCYETRYDTPKNLLITLLISYNRNKGLGSEMLKFAENFSKKVGCEGRLKLKASGLYTPNRVPHTFYRKYGFTTDNSKIDKKLDKFIKNNKDATQLDFQEMLCMYYRPQQKVNKLQSLWGKIKNFFN